MHQPYRGGWPAPDITISVVAPAGGGTITNTASISAATSDPDGGNNTTSQVTNVNPLADLMIQKTASTMTPLVGDSILFAVNVRNNGPSDAVGVVVTDILPAGLVYISDTAEVIVRRFDRGMEHMVR